MAGFFNTNWDLGNMFNSPYSNTGFYNQDEDDSIVPRPGNEGPEAMPTNTWGAPTNYNPSEESNNIFNPYSAGGNNFYNPYSFGQTTTGTQYGGGQQPWWMNYNMVNPVNPPNIPTTNVQPQAQGQPPRNQGTGPNGKDLTYAETIKYFGLYNDAESAFAAGDKQAAYRKDHQQWRDSQGYYSTDGLGKQEGQSDLDYTGRTIGDNTIMGDRQKLAGLSGLFGNIPDNLKAYFSGGSSGMDSNFLNQERGVEGSLPYSPVRDTAMQSYLNDSQKYSMRNFNSDNVEMALATGALDPERVGVISPQDWRRQFPETQRDYNKGFDRAENLFSTPINSNYFQQVGPQSNLPIPQYQDNMKQSALTGFNQVRYPWGTDTEDNRFQPTGVTSALDNYKAMLGIQDRFTGQEQISPYGRTENGMTVPVPLEDINIFSNIRDTSAIDSLAAQEVKKAQAQAQAQAQAKAQAEAAEKARQATAAQARMNNRYETGPVPKNIFTTPKAGTGSSGPPGRNYSTPAAPKKTTTTRRYTGRYGL